MDIEPLTEIITALSAAFSTNVQLLICRLEFRPRNSTLEKLLASLLRKWLLSIEILLVLSAKIAAVALNCATFPSNAQLSIQILLIVVTIAPPMGVYLDPSRKM